VGARWKSDQLGVEIREPGRSRRHPQTVHGHAATQAQGPRRLIALGRERLGGDPDFSLVHPFSQPRTHGAADLATFLSDHNRFKFPNDIQQRVDARRRGGLLPPQVEQPKVVRWIAADHSDDGEITFSRRQCEIDPNVDI
jgi:hypothetical protein